MRLNRYLSLCGLGSRRSCEQIIEAGRVAINGQRVQELATVVETGSKVTVDGSLVQAAVPMVVVLHKPTGYLCTREDTHGRATIYDILPAKFQHLHHVGRLDQDSEGLILLTNQGDLSQRLLHPSEGVEKEYEVTLDKEFEPNHAAKLTRGIQTVEGFGRAEHVHVDAPRRVHVVLKQGLKRQIRLMFYEIGYEVVRLIRVRIGALRIAGLGVGQWRELRATEVQQFFKAAKPRKRASNVKDTVQEDGDSFAPTRRRTTPTARKDVRTDPDRRTSPRAGDNDKPRLGGARKAYGQKRYGAKGRDSSDERPDTDRRTSPRSGDNDKPRLGGARKAYGQKRYSAKGRDSGDERPDTDRRTSPRAREEGKSRPDGARKAYGQKRYGAKGRDGDDRVSSSFDQKRTGPRAAKKDESRRGSRGSSRH